MENGKETEFVPEQGPAGMEVRLTMEDFVPHERTYYEFILECLASRVEQHESE
ncbi:hypothetical protein [Paenibacillus apiarius]|uniref:Uncharacterized protein n=1 Tax=Paenibacillus apiarius TaxID=46240 RepID=A0ABT4DW75_9BACL|nr:hypothetical protein [Paenibacillus apiarius]MCY9521604.1 hypothetical protein [Paenibacillus apiarius]MCY9560455.1 hypothetical protein [Paenibacillus apiarius]MCY9685295.1 hypothetical protein [Paenibacillus apiarius]MEC0192884.1 hypothetical protein [Paenibacillus apiarius]